VSSASQKVLSVQEIRRPGPGCLLQILWFIFIGCWLGGTVSAIAWFLNITIIGLPLGMWLINQLPLIMVLSPSSKKQVILETPKGVVVVEKQLDQVNFILRSLFFIFIGWWWSGIWMALSYLACLTIIGLPLGMVMYCQVPAMTTLKRY